MTTLEEAALVTLLERRYGDGSIYLQSREERLLLKKAVQLGLVTRDGYVTAAGQAFIATRRLDADADPSTTISDHLRDELLGEA